MYAVVAISRDFPIVRTFLAREAYFCGDYWHFVLELLPDNEPVFTVYSVGLWRVYVEQVRAIP